MAGLILVTVDRNASRFLGDNFTLLDMVIIPIPSNDAAGALDVDLSLSIETIELMSIEEL